MNYITGNSLDLGKKESDIRYNLYSILYYVYNQIPLDYDKMKKLYENIEVDCDYDYYDYEKEDDYYNCNGPKFVSNEMEDDEYVYKFNSKLNGHRFPEPYAGEKYNNKLIREIHEFLKEKSPKKLTLKNIHKIKFINDTGVNKDSRGIRDLEWKLHFWPEYTVQSDHSLKLHDLIVAAYKIKSHKFERWFEMFSGLDNEEFYVEYNSLGEKKWKEITTVLNFYHESE